MSSEYERYVDSDFVTHLHPKEFASFNVLGFWKEKETMFPVLSRMAMDIISVQASSVASESALLIKWKGVVNPKNKSQPAYLEMKVSMMTRVQQYEVNFYTFDEEIALDASSEGTMSPGGPRVMRCKSQKKLKGKTLFHADRSTGLSAAMNQLPDEAIALAAASHIERELHITPWKLSSNFVACTN
ncbi:zinc finger BED domain-containing protein RICESLEEPER 2-like protein [Tanacetum coccineum]|uniref:Zinc finger BED domain-containing protein RICESLEEPER 2-like protein n=1 Tax=Tanacetum coccineum TaxID=301880 RepID=A0ABQ5AL27_9ASTR